MFKKVEKVEFFIFSHHSICCKFLCKLFYCIKNKAEKIYIDLVKSYYFLILKVNLTPRFTLPQSVSKYTCGYYNGTHKSVSNSNKKSFKKYHQ